VSDRFAACCDRASRQIEFNILGVGRSGWLFHQSSHWGRVDGVEVAFCPFCGVKLPPSPGGNRPLAGKTICFDVDRVVAKGGHPYSECVPYPEAVANVRELKALGATIHWLTARYMGIHDNDQEKARKAGEFELKCWLRDHGIPFDGVFFGKPAADFYPDDRGFRLDSEVPGSWDSFRKALGA
jgi:hypothetical protein